MELSSSASSASTAAGDGTAVPQNYLDVLSRDELTARAERLAYDCGKVMQSIGKFPMWEDWLDEEDMYDDGPDREGFWEDRCKEAWAAESTARLSEEQRAEHEKRVVELRKQWVKLTYEAGCASVMYWEQEEEGEEFSADALYYWQKQIERVEKIIEQKKERERRRAAAEEAERKKCEKEALSFLVDELGTKA